MRLSRLWDFEWLPERALKDRYPIVPDGIVRFTIGVTFAVELENSVKSVARRKQILAQWDAMEGINLVLFVATKDAVFLAWQRVIVEATPRMAVSLCHWSELQHGTPDVWTPRGAVSLFERRGFG